MSFENHPSASAQFTLISPSATPFYKANFEGLDGWSGTGGTTYARLSDATRNGSRGLALAATNEGTPPVYEASARRLLSGFTVGQTYLFTAWGKLNGSTLGSGLGLRIGVLSGPQSPWQTDVLDKWASFSLLFTATQTSHRLILEASNDGGNYSFWNDVAVSVGVDPLSVSEGDVTLDKGVAPYGQSSVTVPLMDEALLERLDPYANQRVKITAAADGHWETVPPVYSAWFENYRNHFPNPGARSSARFSSYAGTNGNVRVDETVSGVPWSLSGMARRTTWTAAPTNNGDMGIIVGTQGDSQIVTPGTPWTIEYTISASTDTASTPPSLYSASGSRTTLASSGQTTLTVAPQRRWLTFTADATALDNSLRIIQTMYGKTAGDWMQISDVLLYPGPKADVPLIDGNDPATWQQTTLGPELLADPSFDVAGASTWGNVSGTTQTGNGVRVSTVPSGNNDYSAGLNANFPYGPWTPMQQGRTFRMMARVRKTTAGTAGAVRVRALESNSGENRLWPVIVSIALADMTQNQWYTVYGDYTFGAREHMSVQLNILSAPGAVIEWADVNMSEVIARPLPPQADAQTRYRWLGNANGSTSVMERRTVVKAAYPIWVEDNPRTFDLVMRNRVVNHAEKTVNLDLATDEAVLMTYAPLADDNTAVGLQDSLRSIIDYVLGKASPGAALEPGTLDVPFRVLNSTTNMLTDPRYARTEGGGFSIDRVSVTTDTTWVASQNLWGAHLHSPTDTDGYLTFDNKPGGLPYGMQAGKTYTFSATGSVRSTMGGTEGIRARSVMIFYRSGTGGWSSMRSSAVPNKAETGASAGTRVSVTVTLPPTTTEVMLRAYHGHTSGTITWRAFRLSETVLPDGAHNVEYFDGARPASTEYTYQWSGTADASTSRRIALIDRAPELLMWNAGDDAWSFLEPLLTSSKLKLWADEQRRWWLTDPAEYSVPGRVIATVSNTVEGTDTIDADDGPQLDGAIARFSWIDYNGDRQQRDDFAGSPGRVRVFEFDRPYPGPGTAEAIMRRYTSQKRTQEVTVPSDYRVTPGQEISISLPGTADQLGRLQSVHWQLAEGVMDLGASGITEVTPGTWLARDPEQDWDDVTDTETWGSLT